MKSRVPLLLLLFSFLIVWGCAKRPWDVLSKPERATLAVILAHWETWVPAKKADGIAPMITFEELYAGLGPEEAKFLDRIRAIKPKKENHFENWSEGVEFKKLEGRQIRKEGNPAVLDPQYLPAQVFSAYEIMMQAMQRDLGRRLYVDSGYRSPAYQLYTFLFYLPGHGYSLEETRRWVALPGQSEHGAPERQAIDFINEEGINGDDGDQTAEDFEKLPEYGWLEENAGRFGFELSYPRGNPDTTFEPWHWRYTGSGIKN